MLATERPAPGAELQHGGSDAHVLGIRRCRRTHLNHRPKTAICTSRRECQQRTSRTLPRRLTLPSEPSGAREPAGSVGSPRGWTAANLRTGEPQPTRYAHDAAVTIQRRGFDIAESELGKIEKSYYVRVSQIIRFGVPLLQSRVGGAVRVWYDKGSGLWNRCPPRAETCSRTSDGFLLVREGGQA
jgi:hypothetical protein